MISRPQRDSHPWPLQHRFIEDWEWEVNKGRNYSSQIISGFWRSFVVPCIAKTSPCLETHFNVLCYKLSSLVRSTFKSSKLFVKTLFKIISILLLKFVSLFITLYICVLFQDSTHGLMMKKFYFEQNRRFNLSSVHSEFLTIESFFLIISFALKFL